MQQGQPHQPGSYRGQPGQRFGAKPEWYTVLGVSDLSPIEDIRRAYFAKIQAYHPDKVANLGQELRELAEQKSQEINAAYETAQKKLGFR